MERFNAKICSEAGRARNRADRAVVDQVAHGLNASAQKSIGRTAGRQPLFRGKRHDFPSLREGRGKRLFSVYMLSGAQRH